MRKLTENVLYICISIIAICITTYITIGTFRNAYFKINTYPIYEEQKKKNVLVD